MRYFHNKRTKTVYAVDAPTVERRYVGYGPARFSGHTLHATLHATSYLKPRSDQERQWEIKKSNNFDSSYTEAEARRGFDRDVAAIGVEISREEYERLLVGLVRPAPLPRRS